MQHENEPSLINLGEEQKTVQVSIESEKQCGQTSIIPQNVELPSKSVGAVHGNHYNHCNGGKS